MRFTSRDTLAETSAAIAHKKPAKIAEINGTRLSSKISAVVSKVFIYTILNVSTPHQKANLQSATVRRNLRVLYRELVSLLAFFPLFLKLCQDFRNHSLTAKAVTSHKRPKPVWRDIIIREAVAKGLQANCFSVTKHVSGIIIIFSNRITADLLGDCFYLKTEFSSNNTMC